MPDLADLTDALIALIPEDGSRITNDQIQAALEQEAGEPISDDALKEIKNLVVAMGAAEGVKGPGGGLKAPGVEAPARAAPAASGGRTRRTSNGASAPAAQAPIAPGTTAASVLTGELRNQRSHVTRLATAHVKRRANPSFRPSLLYLSHRRKAFPIGSTNVHQVRPRHRPLVERSVSNRRVIFTHFCV